MLDKEQLKNLLFRAARASGRAALSLGRSYGLLLLQFALLAARCLGWTLWVVFIRSARTMGFRPSLILSARLGLLFFAGLYVFYLYTAAFSLSHTGDVMDALSLRVHRKTMAFLKVEWLWRSHDIDRYVSEASLEYGVEADLIHAVIAAESNYEPDAISRVGACGLMQLMPATARERKGGNPFDPRRNIQMGASYLADLKSQFKNQPRLVAAAYNAGPGAVKKYKGVPPYRETRDFVARVMAFYEERKKGKT